MWTMCFFPAFTPHPLALSFPPYPLWGARHPSFSFCVLPPREVAQILFIFWKQIENYLTSVLPTKGDRNCVVDFRMRESILPERKENGVARSREKKTIKPRIPAPTPTLNVGNSSEKVLLHH